MFQQQTKYEQKHNVHWSVNSWALLSDSLLRLDNLLSSSWSVLDSGAALALRAGAFLGATVGVLVFFRPVSEVDLRAAARVVGLGAAAAFLPFGVGEAGGDAAFFPRALLEMALDFAGGMAVQQVMKEEKRSV